MNYNWQEYRARRRAFWLTFLVGGVGLVCSGILHTPLGWWVAGLWFVVLLVANIRWIDFSCPRCGNAFHADFIYANPYSRACLHCKLPLWRERDDEGTTQASDPAT